jgi:3-oxoadipate enol-lactonase
VKVTANGIGLRYVLEGPAAGPLVTLSHPLAAALELWDPQAAALVGAGYRVLRYDARGHGGSDAPAGPYTTPQMAEDVRALWDALGVARSHFVGLSMGGIVGMELALRCPARLGGLVLADTTSRYAPATATMWQERIRAAEAAGMEAVVESTMAIWFTEAYRARETAAVDAVRGMFRKMIPAAYVAAVRAIADVDLTDAIGTIGRPTLVLVGERDPGTPPAMARVLHERIPGARLVVLPGAMHCSSLEAAAAFNAAVLAFLAEPACAS